MLRQVVLGAVVGGLSLLAPYAPAAAQSLPLDGTGVGVDARVATLGPLAPSAAHGTARPLYALDNPAQPGDAFPNSPYSGGTD